MNIRTNFIMECPVCNSKISLRKIQKGDSTIFACSDKDDPNIGCKSVITINIDDVQYDENYNLIEKLKKTKGNGKKA